MALDGQLTPKRHMAPLTEGVGYVMPGPRHPGHEDTQWYELDLDDEFDDPDAEPFDPLPTLRHRQLP